MRDAGLEDRISRALADPAAGDLEQLDRLLTDCAAEALRLRLEWERVNRNIDAAPTSNRADDPEGIHALLLRRRNLAAAGRHLSRLMEKLRDLRDQAAA